MEFGYNNMPIEDPNTRIIFANYDGTVLKAKELRHKTFIYLLPRGLAQNRKITINRSYFPTHGELVISYIENEGDTAELLLMRQLLRESPIANIVRFRKDERPPRTAYMFEDNIKHLELRDIDAQEKFADVINLSNEQRAKVITDYLDEQDPKFIRGYCPYIESLCKPPQIWEEMARHLLYQEWKLLLAMVEEINGGFEYFKNHIRTRLHNDDFSDLISRAFWATVGRDMIFENWRSVCFDITATMYDKDKNPRERFLHDLEEWLDDPPPYWSIGDFRLHKPMQFHKSHPMTYLDPRCEQFFLKLSKKVTTAEVLYIRAVYIRSLFMTYVFQQVIHIWDECLLNGHLWSLGGFLPLDPTIGSRVRHIWSGEWIKEKSEKEDISLKSHKPNREQKLEDMIELSPRNEDDLDSMNQIHQLSIVFKVEEKKKKKKKVDPVTLQEDPKDSPITAAHKKVRLEAFAERRKAKRKRQAAKKKRPKKKAGEGEQSIADDNVGDSSTSETEVGLDEQLGALSLSDDVQHENDDSDDTKSGPEEHANTAPFAERTELDRLTIIEEEEKRRQELIIKKTRDEYDFFMFGYLKMFIDLALMAEERKQQDSEDLQENTETNRPMNADDDCDDITSISNVRSDVSRLALLEKRFYS